MRSRYKITDKDGIYFMTSTIIEWIPFLLINLISISSFNLLPFAGKKKGCNYLAMSFWIITFTIHYILDDHSVIELDLLPV